MLNISNMYLAQLISQEHKMRHYEFCVDLIVDDDDEDDDGVAERFEAVSCEACTEVKFSTSISLFRCKNISSIFPGELGGWLVRQLVGRCLWQDSHGAPVDHGTLQIIYESYYQQLSDDHFQSVFFAKCT